MKLLVDVAVALILVEAVHLSSQLVNVHSSRSYLYSSGTQRPSFDHSHSAFSLAGYKHHSSRLTAHSSRYRSTCVLMSVCKWCKCWHCA